ncbi:hypothetical protein [Paenibacillus chitinolyticus]|uniref:hypothetical protein n=1 Tax=Paenibacillus chitinolyticus TaxID=79263 RepID=UPI00365AEB68
MLNEAYSSEEGTDINLFVSARELASWGQLHLSKGMWNGVRMYNQTGPNPGGYSYLEDIRTFGNTVYGCLNGMDLQADRTP